MANFSTWADETFDELVRLAATFGGRNALTVLGSAVFMISLHAGRELKLLRDDEAENLQRSQSILGTNRLPEVLQGYPRTLSLLRRKKVPSGWSRITFLLERFVDWLRTNLRASKERRQTIQESHQVSQSSSADGHYDGCFWGDRAQLDRFLQAYAVERVKLEARRRGHVVQERMLQDGAIRLEIQEVVA